MSYPEISYGLLSSAKKIECLFEIVDTRSFGEELPVDHEYPVMTGRSISIFDYKTLIIQASTFRYGLETIMGCPIFQSIDYNPRDNSAMVIFKILDGKLEEEPEEPTPDQPTESDERVEE